MDESHLIMFRQFCSQFVTVGCIPGLPKYVTLRLFLYKLSDTIEAGRKLKMIPFWVMVRCSLIEVDRHYRGEYCLHHHCDNEGSMHLYNITLL
jgi:hypothetical protein